MTSKPSVLDIGFGDRIGRRRSVLVLVGTVMVGLLAAEVTLHIFLSDVSPWIGLLGSVGAGTTAAVLGGVVACHLLERRQSQVKEEIAGRARELEDRVADRARELEAVSNELREEIEERKAVEISLSEWKARYEAATAATGNVLYDWNSVTNEVTWGGNHEGVLGYTQEQLDGGMGRWIELIHPVDRPVFQRQIERLQESRAPVNTTYRMQREDGLYITVEDRGRFFFDSIGGAVHMVGFLVDVTEKNRALEALRERDERMRAIVDTATEGVISIDSQGVIDTFNTAAERLFGFEASEVLGQNVKMLMPPPDSDQHDGYLKRYLDTGERHIIGIGREVTGQRKDGSTFPIDLSVGEGFASGRRFFTAIVRDISERKELQAKLNLTERLAAVGELAAGVAHEVNNPINTIINCAQLIEDGDDSPDLTRTITQEGERIAAIVKDLLRFARDDREKPQPTPVAEVLQRTLSLVRENLKRHGIEVRVDVPEDLPEVKARFQQLQQVMLNLLINAKDALLQDPENLARRIRITAEHQNGVDAGSPRVLLRVEDNGPGIPRDLLDRIFQPFVTTKRARGGTGLGLSVSRSIIEEYGGSIEVDSVEGEFSEFRILLPVADASPEQR